MADFFKSTREFISGVASDAVHFPKTKQAWPQFKQAARDFYNDTKNELFFFRRATLYPAAGENAATLEALLKQETTTEKTEGLLALKSQTAEKLGDIADSQWEKGARAGLWTLGAAVVTAAVSAAVAPVALFVAPVAVVIAGAAAVTKFFTNGFQAAGANEKLASKIDRELIDMASGEARAAVFAAPSLQQAMVDRGVLKQVFTLGANRKPAQEEKYAALVARLPKPEIKPAAPEAPQA
ncbi:MAG TPA: hypothetical protein VEF76_15225 [Patescibacteria group bacterium]|nr:hypothetical protein [Patescibacteria group bacterium]